MKLARFVDFCICIVKINGISYYFRFRWLFLKHNILLKRQKTLFWTRNHRCRRSRPFFLDSSRHFSSKTLSFHGKKNFFWIFSIKSNFSSIFPLQPYDKPYLNEKRHSKCNDNHYSCRVKVLDDIKVQKNPRTGILACILGHNLTSKEHRMRSAY